jgi:crotonobetainyl-CoA:carnitine CoA-transferase CaiB-like acyl-CoA transferase
VSERHPHLVQVAIVGHPAPDQDVPGHDLTYASQHWLVAPPTLPRTLVADLGGAERAASTALALLRARDAGGGAGSAEVALADAAAFFSLPLRHGVTTDGGLLGGGDPFYGVYRASDGWIAVAALEPKFRTRVAAAVGGEPRPDSFCTRTTREWAKAEDVPLAIVIERPFDSGL